jgi:hypothetical protein
MFASANDRNGSNPGAAKRSKRPFGVMVRRACINEPIVTVDLV